MLKEYGLEGKKALITGGSTGLGRATALVFAEAGADVAIAARTVKNLESAAEEIRRHGTHVITIPTDVSDSAQVDAMVAKATEEFGQVDILVNAAGMGVEGPVAPLPERPESFLAEYRGWRDHTVGLSDEMWIQCMNTNVGSLLYTSRAVGPQMLERKRGKIVNISSGSGVMAEAYHAAYGTSKACMNMLTKILAVEWAPYNINVNAILPGWFLTEMTRWDFEDEEVYRARTEGTPLGRITDPRDLGLLSLYLASQASDWMTGQCLSLDGGGTAVRA